MSSIIKVRQPMISTNHQYRPQIALPLQYIRQGQYYILTHINQPIWVVINKTGFKIAGLCNGCHTIQDISRIVAAEYRLSYQQAKEDVKSFLSSLEEKGWFNKIRKKRNHFFLKTVFFHLTEHCNLNCKHCYTSSNPAISTETPTKKILNIIDELSHLGGKRITLSGGEPLTHPDIIRIIKYASAKLQVQLLTNGTLIDQETASLLAGLGVRVQVSLDGSTAEVHDRIRGKDAYDRAKRGIELLIRAGAKLKMNLCTVIMKDNFDDLLDIVKLTKELGVPKLRFLPLRRVGRAGTTWPQTEASTAEYINFFRLILTQSHTNLQISSGLSGLLFSLLQEGAVDRWCPVGCKLDIFPSGDVYPCILMKEKKFHLGNIYHCKLEDIFSSAKFKQLSHDCHTRREKIDRCRNCLWRNFCQTGCPGQAYAHTGSLLGIDSFCRLRQELYPKIIFKLAQEKLHANKKQHTELEWLDRVSQ